jgi:hypothetical protein
MKEMTHHLVLTNIYAGIHIMKTVSASNSNTENEEGCAQVFRMKLMHIDRVAYVRNICLRILHPNY